MPMYQQQYFGKIKKKKRHKTVGGKAAFYYHLVNTRQTFPYPQPVPQASKATKNYKETKERYQIFAFS